jgi:hypothetical protein
MSFKAGQKVKDQYGKTHTVIGEHFEWDRSINTTGGKFHPIKIYAV